MYAMLCPMLICIAPIGQHLCRVSPNDREHGIQHCRRLIMGRQQMNKCQLSKIFCQLIIYHQPIITTSALLGNSTFLFEGVEYSLKNFEHFFCHSLACFRNILFSNAFSRLLINRKCVFCLLLANTRFPRHFDYLTTQYFFEFIYSNMDKNNNII